MDPLKYAVSQDSVEIASSGQADSAKPASRQSRQRQFLTGVLNMPVRAPRCDASIAIILLGLLVAFALLSPISTRFESARRLNEPEAFTTQYALARFDGRLQGQVNTGYGELP